MTEENLDLPKGKQFGNEFIRNLEKNGRHDMTKNETTTANKKYALKSEHI